MLNFVKVFYWNSNNSWDLATVHELRISQLQQTPPEESICSLTVFVSFTPSRFVWSAHLWFGQQNSIDLISKSSLIHPLYIPSALFQRDILQIFAKSLVPYRTQKVLKMHISNQAIRWVIWLIRQNTQEYCFLCNSRRLIYIKPFWRQFVCY